MESLLVRETNVYKREIRKNKYSGSDISVTMAKGVNVKTAGPVNR